MLKRIITGLVLALVAVGTISFLPSYVSAGLILVVTFLAALEYADLVGWGAKKRYIFASIVLLLPLALISSLSDKFHHNHRNCVTIIAFTITISLVSMAMLYWPKIIIITLLKYSQGKKHLPGRGGVFLSILMGYGFIPFVLTMLFLLEVAYGRELIMLLLLQVAASDTMAYFVGRALGKHPLAPKISPNKTVEGMLGGMIASALVTWFFLQYKYGDTRIEVVLSMLILAVIVSLSTVIGDLFESMLKREAGVKDSGKILPGHGGVYDRIDGLIAAAPFFMLGLYVIVITLY